jgi:TrmH family RNA methyltransferase
MMLTSLDNPRVKAVVKLREGRERRRSGLFIAEGRREVERAIQAGLTLRELYVAPQLTDGQLGQVIESATATTAGSVVEVSAAVLRKMAYHAEPEGVLAVVKTPQWSLDDLPLDDAALLLVAVGTEKPGNLGAMVRTAAAAGCAGVIAAGAPVDAFNPNAIRASTCAVFSVPTVTATQEQAIDWLTRGRVRVIAATLGGSVIPTVADLHTAPLAIAIGPEDTGLSDAWLDAADATGGARVRIPMAPGVVDSLNASVAAAVLLFEVRRQRALTGLTTDTHG